MNDSLEETASLYVLDQLEPRERALVEARLLREPDLAALVRDYESALARGIRALPPQSPPASLFARIESEIEGRIPHSVRAESADKLARSAGSTPAFRWMQWGIAAVIAVSLGILAVQSLRPTQPVFVVVGLDAHHNTFTELPGSANGGKDPDARFIQLASLATDYWRNPGALPAQAAPATAGNRGYALFDPASQQGFIAIEQLPVLTGNQRYHLWVIDDSSGRVRDAGVLPLAGVNRGLYSFALNPLAGTPATRPNFFVTIEETGATPETAVRPSGKVVLGKDRI
jgi:anti-sigma-K factor RskA